MTDARPPAVDAYIEAAPKESQPLLRQLRQVIKTAAPGAKEGISYGMPTYDKHGRLVHFAAYKTHVGFYGLGRAQTVYASELKEYLTGRGTMRLRFGQPLPVGLIRKVVQLRARDNRDQERRAGQKSKR